MNISFGDVFIFNEKEYIFLAYIDEIIYAARILDKEKTEAVKHLFEKVSRNGQTVYKMKQNSLYCYVILKTEEYRERMANFAKPDFEEESIAFENTGCKLDLEDLVSIKKEIIDSDSPVPKGLKTAIKDIELPSK